MPCCRDPIKETERRWKISESNVGRHFGKSSCCKDPAKQAERCRKCRENNLGKHSLPQSGGAKAKNSASHLGKVPSEETRVRIRNTNLVWYQTEAGRLRREKQSEAITKLILRGGMNTHIRGSGEHVSTEKGGTFYCRSSYEVGFAQLLDKDPEVVEFLHEAVRVPYSWEGIRHFVVPDFFVRYALGEVVIVEVKPPWQVKKYSQTRTKLSAMSNFAKEQGLKFLWWDGSAYQQLSKGIGEGND